MGTTPQMPNNPLTRAMDDFAAHNQQLRAGGGAVITGEPLPSVRSAAVGREVVAQAPLSEAERAELDAKAIELGLMPRPEGESGPYASFEEAAAAGAPVQRPVQVITKTTDWREPSMSMDSRETARAFIQQPRLPDFSKVYGVNLLDGTVIVDGMEFAMPASDANEFRLYCIRLVQASVMAQLEAAASAFIPALEATSEEMQPVQGDEGADGVQ